MTLIKKKITEVESIVNKADKRKTAGKIYLPKDWIGKKVKTVLIGSLIVMALVVVSSSQVVNAIHANNLTNSTYVPDPETEAKFANMTAAERAAYTQKLIESF